MICKWVRTEQSHSERENIWILLSLDSRERPSANAIVKKNKLIKSKIVIKWYGIKQAEMKEKIKN